jgi:hypothetical protein
MLAMSSPFVIVLCVALAFAVGIASIYFLGKDNPAEEACEDVIKNETGLDIDLSTGEDVSTDTPPSAADGTKSNPS